MVNILPEVRKFESMQLGHVRLCKVFLYEIWTLNHLSWSFSWTANNFTLPKRNLLLWLLKELALFHHLISLRKVIFPVIVKMNFPYVETQTMRQMKAQCQRLAVLSQKVVVLMVFLLLTQILISCLLLQVQLKVKICTHFSCCFFTFSLSIHLKGTYCNY